MPTLEITTDQYHAGTTETAAVAAAVLSDVNIIASGPVLHFDDTTDRVRVEKTVKNLHRAGVR